MEIYSLAPHILAIVALFFIATMSAIVLKRLKTPYTLGLVIVGMTLAYLIKDVQVFDTVRDIRLSHDVIIYILLPTLIFNAAIDIDVRLLIKNLVPILILAIPGLLVSTAIIATMAFHMTPLHVGTAILFGALISATDPIAVVALFKEIGAPEKLSILLDGESLFNDATAIVLFNLIIIILISHIEMNAVNFLVGLWDFLFVFFGGLLTGVVTGYAIVSIIKYSKSDPLIHLALSTILAYLTFTIAEHYLGVSGVMAVLAAGIVLNWHGTLNFPEASKRQLKHFWAYASFICNSFIFLLLGVAELQLINLIGHSNSIIMYIIVAILSVTLARLVIVYFLPYKLFVSSLGKVEKHYKTIIFWGGLKGAVPLALAISLSRHFQDQQLIVELTLGVVLFTLLVQGTTVKPLMKLFRIIK